MKVRNDHRSKFSNLSGLLLAICLSWEIYCDDHSSPSKSSKGCLHWQMNFQLPCRNPFKLSVNYVLLLGMSNCFLSKSSNKWFVWNRRQKSIQSKWKYFCFVNQTKPIANSIFLYRKWMEGRKLISSSSTIKSLTDDFEPEKLKLSFSYLSYYKTNDAFASTFAQAPMSRFWKAKQSIMSLRNNTTITSIGNETALGQQNSTCIFVDSNAARISKLCAYCFILLASFFGNMFIIVIIYKNRDLQKTINYFIVNMAVSDLLYPLIAIPRQITQLVTKSLHWHVAGILGSIFCKLLHFASSLSLFVSVQSLMWIAIDRFFAIVFPMKLGLISSKIRTKAIVSTWILAGVFYFPLLITSGLVEHGNDTFCSLASYKIFPTKETIDTGYHWLHVTICFLAPLLLITVLYSAVVISLKRRSKALMNTAQYEQQHSVKKRGQATKMAIVILVLFYICVIPHTLSHFVNYFRRSCAFQFLFTFISDFMFFLSPVVNPIICLSFVESYRRGLKNIVCYFCGMQDNKRAKREWITLKRIRNLPGENWQGILWRNPTTFKKHLTLFSRLLSLARICYIWAENWKHSS